MTKTCVSLLLALLMAGCTVGMGPNVNPAPDVPDDDDSANAGDDDDTTVADDDDSTEPPADDDDSTEPTGDDDDSTEPTGDDDDTTEPPTPPPAVPVRFVVMGDTGTGGADQYAVSTAIETLCVAQGCDFVLLTGDNIYDEGAENVSDPIWQEKFEDPYANLPTNLLFYPSLGNHDGGFLGTGLDLFRGQVQVDYAAVSARWEMPNRYYARTVENVSFYSLDTSLAFFQSLPIYDSLTDDQGTWLQGELAASTSQWKIAYAHHPYYSNGPHGNAGNYEGLPDWTPFGAAGTGVKDFLDDYVCGNVDLYICGHDHSRQWQVNQCNGTELIVSGGGAKRTDIEGNNPVYWQDTDDDMEGFVWIEILGNQITVEFHNKTGAMEYTGTWTK